MIIIRIGTCLNMINFCLLKVKPVNQIQPITIQYGNNLAENPKLLTDSQLVLIVIFAALSSIPPLLLGSLKTADQLILTGMPFQFIMGLVVPTMIYIFNPQLRDFVWIELMPENMQIIYENFKTKLTLHQTILSNFISKFRAKLPKQTRNLKVEPESEHHEMEDVTHRIEEEQRMNLEEITKSCHPSTSSEDTCDCNHRLLTRTGKLS